MNNLDVYNNLVLNSVDLPIQSIAYRIGRLNEKLIELLECN